MSTSAQADHVAECVKAVTDYRGNRINKWGAITQISAAISSATTSTNEEQRATSGGTYLAMLDEHDRILASAHARGRCGAEAYDSDNDEPNENPSGENRVRRSLSRSRSPVMIPGKIYI